MDGEPKHHKSGIGTWVYELTLLYALQKMYPDILVGFFLPGFYPSSALCTYPMSMHLHTV